VKSQGVFAQRLWHPDLEKRRPQQALKAGTMALIGSQTSKPTTKGQASIWPIATDGYQGSLRGSMPCNADIDAAE